MTSTVHAADLIAQAEAATTPAEIDAIEAQAEGRVTVLDAVEQARTRLFMQEKEMPEAPVVDASPTQQPIMVNTQTLEEVLAAYPAAASDAETLALEPNSYEKAVSGPDEQISQTAYVHFTKPSGEDFIVPLSNVPYYEAKGYTKGAEEDIPDLVAYQAERAATTAEAPPEPTP